MILYFPNLYMLYWELISFRKEKLESKIMGVRGVLQGSKNSHWVYPVEEEILKSKNYLQETRGDNNKNLELPCLIIQ